MHALPPLSLTVFLISWLEIEGLEGLNTGPNALELGGGEGRFKKPASCCCGGAYL